MLQNKFLQVDKANLELLKAKAELKAAIAIYAKQNGLLVLPRPETLRNQL